VTLEKNWMSLGKKTIDTKRKISIRRNKFAH